MSNVMSKFKNIFGFGEYEDEYEEYEEMDNIDIEEVTDESIEPVITGKKSNSKVVNIHSNSSAKVTITRPNAYEDATEICDALKSRRIVVVNTTAMDIKIAQRLLDFISGSCYALGGELGQIEKGVYILSPNNVEVTNELKTELSSKALFNWSK